VGLNNQLINFNTYKIIKMDPVLIYTDTQRIAKDVAILNQSVTVFQGVYNAYKAIGVTATLQEINNLVSWTAKGNGRADFELEFAVDKLLAIAGAYTIGGVAVDQQKLRDLISRPDITGVKAALAASRTTNDRFNGGVRINLLTLTSDVIAKATGADDAIAAIYTYYTKTDDSSQLATRLQAVCDALNAFDTDYSNTNYVTRYKQHIQTGGVIPGVDLINGTCVVSLAYIQAYEAKKAA
jgi:hypothetical protein